MSRGFNNFVAKHMHKVHRPAVERDKRSKNLDDAYEKEIHQELVMEGSWFDLGQIAHESCVETDYDYDDCEDYK